jgi:hypothetical protein
MGIRRTMRKMAMRFLENGQAIIDLDEAIGRAVQDVNARWSVLGARKLVAPPLITWGI